jgi:predicted nucleic acid-binding protein
MAVYYLDTSALVKRYALEKGTNWVFSLTDLAAGHDIYTVRITAPEMIAALFRKARTGEISQDDALQAAGDFKTDWQTAYQIVEINSIITERAMDLAEKYGLRGYDAVHLASALELHRLRCAMELPGLTFISADDEQLHVAAVEGLLVDNPNQYP